MRGKKSMAKCEICLHIMGEKKSRIKSHISNCAKPDVPPNYIKIVENKDNLLLDKNRVNYNSTFIKISDCSSSKRYTESNDSSFKQPKLFRNDLQQFCVTQLIT